MRSGNGGKKASKYDDYSSTESDIDNASDSDSPLSEVDAKPKKGKFAAAKPKAKKPVPVDDDSDLPSSESDDVKVKKTAPKKKVTPAVKPQHDDHRDLDEYAVSKSLFLSDTHKHNPKKHEGPTRCVFALQSKSGDIYEVYQKSSKDLLQLLGCLAWPPCAGAQKHQPRYHKTAHRHS